MNPNHHLDLSTLVGYSAGALSQPLAIVASAHLERCRQCRERLLDADRIGGALVGLQQPAPAAAGAREAMLALLDVEPTPAKPTALAPAALDLVDPHDSDRLPGVLEPWFGRSLRALRWRWVAPGVHRILAKGISGGELMLLRIAPGSRLPLHSHQGNELTLILDGAYQDMLGHFGPGDVADLDGQVQHQPVTAAGVPCICVAALDAPLRFSGPIARVLQPLLGF
ncbi:MAG: ChrR family anti-sigma-E factor [Luteimonas sp.]